MGLRASKLASLLRHRIAGKQRAPTVVFSAPVRALGIAFLACGFLVLQRDRWPGFMMGSGYMHSAYLSSYSSPP